MQPVLCGRQSRNGKLHVQHRVNDSLTPERERTLPFTVSMPREVHVRVLNHGLLTRWLTLHPVPSGHPVRQAHYRPHAGGSLPAAEEGVAAAAAPPPQPALLSASVLATTSGRAPRTHRRGGGDAEAVDDVECAAAHQCRRTSRKCCPTPAPAHSSKQRIRKQVQPRTALRETASRRTCREQAPDREQMPTPQATAGDEGLLCVDFSPCTPGGRRGTLQ